jgi:mono/diheme cytochrome c family protein
MPEGAAMCSLEPRTVQALFAVFMLIAAAMGAEAQERGDARRGLSHARRVCAECHAVSPGETASPNANAPTFKAVANTPGMTATALTVWFRTSHPSMPNLIIGSEDTDDLIAYILTLREEK